MSEAIRDRSHYEAFDQPGSSPADDQQIGFGFGAESDDRCSRITEFFDGLNLDPFGIEILGCQVEDTVLGLIERLGQSCGRGGSPSDTPPAFGRPHHGDDVQFGVVVLGETGGDMGSPQTSIGSVSSDNHDIW